MEISFSNIDNCKQRQRKKIMPSYLLPHTQIGKRKKYVYIKKLLFQLFNPHPHLEGTLINLYMNEKTIPWFRKVGSP